ncbi:MAG: carbohydrate ABC transporter permease [Candidatus Caldatribacteriaceae bacterium]
MDRSIPKRITLMKAVLLYVFLALGGGLMVLPFYWMMVTSVSPVTDITAFPPRWIPSHLVPEHYHDAFRSAPFGRYYLNSLLVALGSVGTSVLFGLLAGYAFVVYRFPLRDFFFLLILSTIMIPFQVTSVSLYMMLSKMGWVDTYWGILAPNLGSALGMFLIRQSIKSVPMDLIEAARLDGAGEMRIVFTIVAPVIKTALATVILILFLGSWNDFLWPLIVINSPELRTVPLGLSLFKDPYGGMNYGPLMAASVIATLPMLIAYVFSQRYVIEGIAITGLKG